MPGPGKNSKAKRKTKPSGSDAASRASESSSRYIPSEEFLGNVYHAEGWSAQADVLCSMLELPDISSRSGLRKIHRNFDAVSSKLNDIYDYGRRVGNESLMGTVVAIYAKMSADAVLRDRIFIDADFLQKVIPLLDNPICYHVGLSALCSFTHHGGMKVRVEIAKKTPVLLQLLEEQPNDMKAAELTITTISHSVAAVVDDDTPPEPRMLKIVDMPRIMRVMLSFVRKPQALLLPTNLLFDHALGFLMGAAIHCAPFYQAYPAVIDFFVACTRSDDITTRASGINGLLRLHTKNFETDETKMDPMKIMNAIGRGWPKHIEAVLMQRNPFEGETVQMLRTLNDFQKAMMQALQDHDLYKLGLKIADFILRTEYAIAQGAFQVEDPRTGRREIQHVGLPFTWWQDSLPHCAKAIRARGKPDEADKADMLDLKYYIMKSQVKEAHVLARKAIQRNPHFGFFYYVLTLGADKPDGLRTAKKGLKCPNLTSYVRFSLLFRAAEHASDLALITLHEAMAGGKEMEQGVAFAMSAYEDALTFINEAPPDSSRMKSVLYVYVLMSLLVKGHEISNDLHELQDAKRRLDFTDEVAKFLSMSISKTQTRLACMEVLNRMPNAWREWKEIIPAYAHTRTEVSPAKAEDDLAEWLEKIDIEDPGINGHDHHHHDHRVTHPTLNLNDVELYRCSWCRNPSAMLKKCSGCGQTRYCDSSCQREHWKNHKQVCKKGSDGS